MDITAFDELASIDDQIIVRDDPDSWLWREEDPFKMDSESQIAIAKSFWEDLAQNDEEIFASTPPIVDGRESSPSYFSLGSQESETVSPTSYAAENCGRIKRRRMLHFAGTGEECLPASSPAFESGEECPPASSPAYESVEECAPASSPATDPPFVSCANTLDSGADEFLMPVPPSPGSDWYSKDEGGKGADDNWMSKCLEQREPHSPPQQAKIVARNANPSEASGISGQSSPSSEGEVLQGPLTPFSKGSTPGWRPSPLTRFRVKATPVAYPFNLVKPNSAHGDVTLNDINQRIKTPRPSRRVIPRDEEKSPQSGSGLSGKSVVACTKIHTEGNGTITIMRTRG